jgi:hypothetical protein
MLGVFGITLNIALLSIAVFFSLLSVKLRPQLGAALARDKNPSLETEKEKSIIQKRKRRNCTIKFKSRRTR